MHSLQRLWRKGETIQVHVDSLDQQGVGTSRLQVFLEPQKETRTYHVSVPQSVPGDELLVEIRNVRRREVSASIVEILKPSDMRIQPRCSHLLSSPPCGGCTFQSLDYRHQLLTKEMGIKKLFGNHGLDGGLVNPVRASPEEWRYRNKMEFSFSPGPKPDIGLRPAGYKFDVVDQRECLLFAQWAMEALSRVKVWAHANELSGYHFRNGSGDLKWLMVREGQRTGERLMELGTSPLGERLEEVEASFKALVADISGSIPLQSAYLTQHMVERGTPSRFEEQLVWGSPTFREILELPKGHRLEFEVAPRAFFQPNPRQAEQIYAHIIGLLDSSPKILDLYCGTGTIALCLAPFCDHVIGVELNPDAVENARKNASFNGIENATFIAGDVAKVLPDLDARTLIVDPPRVGLTPDALKYVCATQASELVYVSCSPTSLVRDLKLLLNAGWEIQSVVPFDMFPHTYHVETVVLLNRKIS